MVMIKDEKVYYIYTVLSFGAIFGVVVAIILTAYFKGCIAIP